MVIDTDIIIRFLTKDDEHKALRFKKFLDSQKQFILTDVTAAEIVWTLKSFYNTPKIEIINHLKSLISHSSVKCNKSLLKETLNNYEQHNISYIDAYTAAYSKLKSDSQVMSYDRGLDKLKEIKRIQP